MIDRLIAWARLRLKERTTHTGLLIIGVVAVAALVPSEVLTEYSGRLTQIAALLGGLHLILSQQPPEGGA
jgi:hypothetical protein